MNGTYLKKLHDEVISEGLCTSCGACLIGCPYLKFYKGKVVPLNNCTLSEGHCYKYCPRTQLDLNAIHQQFFSEPYDGKEMGVVKEILLARSTDPEVLQRTQGGGVAPTLLLTALREGMIDGVIATKMSDDKTPHGYFARDRAGLMDGVGIGNAQNPILEVLNHFPGDSNEKLGIVGLPCQLTSVAKMKAYQPANRIDMSNLRLILGLFCVYVNTSCRYCFDMTSEFADISVGAGKGAPKGWDVVIVRTDTGADLLQKAKTRDMLEVRQISEDNIASLREASLGKKKRALRAIIQKSGDKKNLIYLGLTESIVERLLV